MAEREATNSASGIFTFLPKLSNSKGSCSQIASGTGNNIECGLQDSNCIYGSENNRVYINSSSSSIMGLISDLREGIAQTFPTRWQSLADGKLQSQNIANHQISNNAVVNSNDKRSRTFEDRDFGDPSLAALPHQNPTQIPSKGPQDTAKALCLAIAECNRLVREVSLEEKPKKAAIWKQVSKGFGECSSTCPNLKTFFLSGH